MLWVILEARMETEIAWCSFGKLRDGDMVTDLTADHYKLIELAVIGLSCWEHCHICPSFFATGLMHVHVSCIMYEFKGRKQKHLYRKCNLA